ncbi:MAG: BlaI/MecI/CopY family transcriptional regulator [Gemmatimonadota bacterium]
MKDPRELTDRQIEILDILWERGEATANEVHAALERSTGLTRKTIGTLLHRLERQGVLAYRKDGREYRYRPRLSREDVRRAAVDGLVGGLFRGELPAMVSHALEAGEVDADDVRRIRELIDEWTEAES